MSLGDTRTRDAAARYARRVGEREGNQQGLCALPFGAQRRRFSTRSLGTKPRGHGPQQDVFSHAKTKYPLTGAHVKTACAKCHVFLADTKPYVKYTGLAFTKCSACHADPHKGSFPAACESCHNTNNWHQIAQLQGFDHSKTKYPLLGKHATVGCADCHTHGDFKTSVPFVKCTDCHKDAHKGQFRGRTDGGECAACHTVNSAPVEFKGNSVVLQVSARTQEIPNDYVWVFAGGEPPTAFLKKIGVGFGLRDMTSEAGKEARNASLSKKHLVEV
jgi:hypothetical protein